MGKFKGSIKWYNTTRGFGFIKVDGKEDVFFHKSGVMGSIPTDGTEVTFNLAEGKEGKSKAVEVEAA